MAKGDFSFRTLSFFAAGGAALALAQCTGQVTVGSNMGPDGGDDASGSSSSGGASSGVGSSSGTSSGVSSSSGTGSSSGGTSSSSGGGGGCCPSGYEMYTCTYPGGGAGYACHNPALGCASSTVCGQGCDTAHAGVCGSGSSSGGASSSGGSGLRWVPTCGPPVVSVDCNPDGGLHDEAGAPCPALGSSCSNLGALCGTAGAYSCPIGEQCGTGAPVACPVSSRKHKDGIEYVDDSELERLHDETLRIQLATYNYKPETADPAPRHLGFIIEDMPPATPAVGWSRERVDLYGYVSMVVATMQVQEKEIAELRRELEATRAGASK